MVNTTHICIAFLRGINVGGHHKVPMADLRRVLEQLGMEQVVTILNSGNIIFRTYSNDLQQLEKMIAAKLELAFGFPVPTLIRSAETIDQWLNRSPFEGIALHKDIRLYVSLLVEDQVLNLELPWKSADSSFVILEKRGLAIFSVLDLSVTKTPKGMDALEQFFGKQMTTRNWKTIERIKKKLV